MKKAPVINPELFDSDNYDQHKVEESAEILLEADAIKKDDVLMKKIKEHLDKKKKTITSLPELRKAANRLSQKPIQPDEEIE